MIVVKELFRILSGCVPAVAACLVPALLIYADVVMLDRDCPERGYCCGCLQEVPER